MPPRIATAARTPGVQSAVVNYATEKATIAYLPDQATPAALKEAVVQAGYGVAGRLWASVHSGLDLAAPTGTTLVAAGSDQLVLTLGDIGLAVEAPQLRIEDPRPMRRCTRRCDGSRGG